MGGVGGEIMATATVRLQVSLKDLYDVCCPECKKKIHELVKSKVTDDMVTAVLGDTANKEVIEADRTKY